MANNERTKMYEEGRTALAEARKQQSAAAILPPLPLPSEMSNSEEYYADMPPPAVRSPPRRKRSAHLRLGFIFARAALKSKMSPPTTKAPSEQQAASAILPPPPPPEMSNSEEYYASTPPLAVRSPPRRKSSALKLLKSKMSPPKAKAPGASFDAAASSSSLSTALVVLRAVLGFKRAVRVAPDTAVEPPLARATPPSSIADACSRLSAAGKDDDWTVRNEALLALPQLLAPLASQPEAMRTALDALGEPLVLALSDLRSALVRSACDACREITTAHGRAVAPLVAHLLPQLLLNLGLLKAFSVISATTATVCIGLAPSTAALKVCIANAKASQRQVRHAGFSRLLSPSFAFFHPSRSPRLITSSHHPSLAFDRRCGRAASSTLACSSLTKPSSCPPGESPRRWRRLAPRSPRVVG